MNSTTKWALTTALAGFLFGFDTVVISGANQPIKELWDTTPVFHGFFIMSMALWGTVIGSLFGGIPADRFGRKVSLIWIGVLFTISAIGSGLAPDPYSFSFFRFIGGLGVGASTVAAPMYISEISSAKNRGKLTALYQFFLVLGILIAYLSNYMLQGVGGVNDWRWMLGVEAIPAILYTVMVVSVPKSPRWLLYKKNARQQALEILNRVHEPAEAQARLDEIQAAMLTERLKWLGKFNDRRRQIAQKYLEGITNPLIQHLAKPQEQSAHVYHLFVLTCPWRDQLIEHLQQSKIQTLIHYPIPIHLQRSCQSLKRDSAGLVSNLGVSMVQRYDCILEASDD